MAGRVPNVMVSSTYYDLREIRQQLRGLIEDDLGYRALISELPAFPTDPDATTIENCRKRVEEDADILVLVIGRRYGHVDQSSGKSVTNIEYSTARMKGIPVYAFADRSLLTLYEERKKAKHNDRAAFDATVDDARLFGFLERVRVIDGVWLHPFEVAAEITVVLRTQLAYQMTSGLTMTSRLRSREDLEFLADLPPSAYRLVVDQPLGWEHLFFAELLCAEMSRWYELKREHDVGITYSVQHDVEVAELPSFVSGHAKEAGRIFEDISTLMNTTLQEAMGPSGTPANLRELVFVARQVGKIYQRLLHWAQRVRAANVDDDFSSAITVFASVVDDPIKQITSWGDTIKQSISNAAGPERSASPPDAAPQHINITLRIDLNQEKLNQVMNELFSAFRARGVEV
jgi:Domain of unknown function (DUF4062)